MHIVLIEPDKVLGSSYRRALEQAGHSVAITSDPQAAVNLIDQQKPDVILLELQLPHHNGVELLYELRSYPEWQNVPVLLHTMVMQINMPIAADIQKHLGIAGYLYKPQTSLKQLIESVDRIAVTSLT